MTKEEFDNKPSKAEKLSDEVDDKSSKAEKLSDEVDDKYKFGWSSYSEVTNGRFAMIGFLAIILIELISQQSFLKWAGML